MAGIAGAGILTGVAYAAKKGAEVIGQVRLDGAKVGVIEKVADAAVDTMKKATDAGTYALRKATDTGCQVMEDNSTGCRNCCFRVTSTLLKFGLDLAADAATAAGGYLLTKVPDGNDIGSSVLKIVGIGLVCAVAAKRAISFFHKEPTAQPVPGLQLSLEDENKLLVEATRGAEEINNMLAAKLARQQNN